MGWYMNYYKKCSCFTAQIGAIYGHAMDMRTQRQHSRNMGVWWGVKWHAPIKAISYYNSSHTLIELPAAAAGGLDCC